MVGNLRAAVIGGILFALGVVRLVAAEDGDLQQGWNPHWSQPLTEKRIAALPEEERGPWVEYLQRSEAAKARDAAALERELKAGGLEAPTAAPFTGKDFEIEAKKPLGWYGTKEARAMADVLLSFQAPDGGWSKLLDYTKGPRKPGMAWYPMAAPDRKDRLLSSTIDNHATTEELRFLARVVATGGGERYHDALERGIDYLLEAQYPNGGWPQFYPLKGVYHDTITFNDDALVHVLQFLVEATTSPLYASVDAERKALMRVALERGIDVVLRTQVVRDGKPTVWGAQHDPLTLEVAGARMKEPPSLSGAESASLLAFLMTIKNPSREVVAAIEGGLAWFARESITGLAVSMNGGWTFYTAEPESTTKWWARFYDPQTEKPIFCGAEDGVIYPTFDAMWQHGNRATYQYYTTKPGRLLERDEAEWRRMQALPSPEAEGWSFAGTREAALIELVGDSTVAEGSGWGETFAQMFGPAAQCIDLARPGHSTKSFRDEGYWAKALAMKPKWVLIQFGHNDMPGKGPTRETDPSTTYAENLRKFVEEARAGGAQPVLVTPLVRRTFDKEGKLVDGLAPYAAAMIAVAKEKDVPVVDLHARSMEVVQKLGPKESEDLGPIITEGPHRGKHDGTHLSPKGAELMAGLVADEVKKNLPAVGKMLRE